jgi:hypothetical protein
MVPKHGDPIGFRFLEFRPSAPVSVSRSPEAGEAVADEAEAMFVGRTRGRMGTEEARDCLDRQSPERHAISPCA